MDSDDYIEENFLKSFEGNLDADLVVGNSTWLDNGGTEINSNNISLIGMSREEYERLTETQKKQIRDFALFVKNQNKEMK